MNRITLRLRYGRDCNRRLSPKHVRDAHEGESPPGVSVQAPPSGCSEGGAASDSDMRPWLRVPSDLTPLDGSHRASRTEATVDLLLRWHREETPTVRALAGAWGGWSLDATHRLVALTSAWAEQNGAALPRSDRRETPDKQEPNKDRTCEAGQTPAIARSPNADRTPTERRADPPRAGVEGSVLSEREKKGKRLEEKKEGEEGPRSAPALPPVSVPAVDDDPDLLRAWAALCAMKPGGKRALTPARRARLAAALQRHGAEALVRVGRWAATSGHERAVFLRARCDVDTLLWASKLQGYIEMSAEPDVDVRALAAFVRWRALTGSAVEASPALAAPILAAIEAVGCPATIRVIEWVLTGQDDRARFLRSKGITSLAGVLRLDKLHGRVDLANAANPTRVAPPVVTPTTAADSPAEPIDTIDLGPNASLGYAPTDHLRRTRRTPT